MNIVFKRADLIDAGWELEGVPYLPLSSVTKRLGDGTDRTYVATERGDKIVISLSDDAVEAHAASFSVFTGVAADVEFN